MGELIIKADIRVVRRFLAKLSTDDRLDGHEQWFAQEALRILNELNERANNEQS